MTLGVMQLIIAQIAQIIKNEKWFSLAVCVVFAYAAGMVKWLLSVLIDIYLQAKYTIPHSQNQRSLPSLRFTWPNGQGTEKFFEGRKAARRWRDQQGPIYRIWSGITPEIIITSPAHAQQFFHHSHKHTKATNNNSGWLFGEVLGSCVGLVSGAQWRKLRRYVDEPFAHRAATAFTSTIISQAQDFVLDLPSTYDTGQNHRLLEISRDLQFFPFFVVATRLFGDLSPSQKAQLRDLAPLREELFRHVISGGINRFPIAKWIPWSGVKTLNAFNQSWRAFVRDAYESALARSAKTRVDHPPVVALWSAVQNGQIRERECLQTLDEALYANLDVTTHAVAWNIILLAQHPDIQAQLRNESKAILDAKADASEAYQAIYERYVEREDTLLAGCILESARLRPILPFSNPEAAPKDHLLDGYLIPANTNVIVDSYALNISNPFWKDGTTYNPRRFSKLKKEEIRYNMWRFGLGPRQCLGRYFADRMLRAITAEMILKFEIGLDDIGAEIGRENLQEESWVGLPDVRLLCVSIDQCH